MEKHTTISFQNIVEHAPLGMIVIGLDERLILANRCMRAILGLEVGELDSLTLSNITHPEENSLYRECFRRLQNSEPTVSFDARCLHKQGHEIWLQFNIALESDQSADSLYYIAQVNDISAKYQSEPAVSLKQDAWLDKQQSLDSLLNHMPAMIGYWDSNLINKFGNKAYEEWFGYSADELFGKHISKVIGEKLYALNLPYLQKVLQGEPQFFERTIVDVAGNERYTQASYLPDYIDGHVNGFFVLVTDVTELKCAQKRISDSEASLRAIYDNLPFLAWMKDQDGRYLQANKHWLQAVGIAELNLMSGITDFDIWPKELAEHYRAVDQDVMQNLQQIVLTEKALDGGQETWTETIKTPVVAGNGQVLGTTGLARDITEKRQAEEGIRKYSERLHLASKAAAIGICEWDIVTGLADWNERMYEIFGIPQGNVIDYQTWAHTVFIEDLPPAKDKVRRLIRDKQEMYWTFRIHRLSDGELRYIQASAIASCNSKGELEKIVGVNLDVTEFKRIEIALREKEAHLARAQAQAHLGSWSSDIFSNVVEWSDENYRIFGVPKGSKITHDVFLSLVHPDDQKMVIDAWEAAMQGQLYDIQHRIIVDGQIKWVRERAEMEFAADGSFLRGIGTSQDITELKETARSLESSRLQLRQLAARREKAREEERKRIAREVHDELGQLLTALRLDISMLRIEFTSNNPQLLKKIHSIMGLLDKTIQVTRNVATSLRPSAIEMGIVPALEWLTKKFSEQSGIKCHFFYPEENLNMSEENAIVVFRITQESLTNVLRHAEADQVNISLRQDSGNYCLEIEDNGRGFDVSAPRKTKSFGLIGIQERSLMLGGEASISSQLGNGTSLKVRIPVHPASQAL